MMLGNGSLPVKFIWKMQFSMPGAASRTAATSLAEIGQANGCRGRSTCPAQGGIERQICPPSGPDVSDNDAPTAFTLIEVLVAVALLAAALAIAFSAYFSVSKAWQRGVTLADNLNHGDYLMEQIVNGLRCAFYPPPQTNVSGGGADYGFWLEKHGSGAEARDVISWVKTGAALLGPDNELYRGLHRVRVSIDDDQEGIATVAVRAWRPYANPDAFDAVSLDPFFVSGKVQGMSCRVSTNRTEDGWQWQDEWEHEATNHLPSAVEVILYLDPIDPDDAPVEMKRMVEIPLAPLSWRVK